MNMTDEDFMSEALELAHKGKQHGEVPVGAVVVLEGAVIGRGFNRPIMQQDPTAHAEVVALRSAALTMGNYRLVDTTLYVTLEPCLMCLGAMIHARVSRVVFGASDTRLGTTKHLLSDCDHRWMGRDLQYEGGVLQDECSQLLKDFFKQKR
tara:strand:+ start:1800 stop:2252 length:453 start_codon:yes stop_codon:yes gene_type:complete